MHKSGNAFIGAVVAVVLATLALPVSAPAQPAPTAQSEEARQNELDAAYRASEQAGTAGPADIKDDDAKEWNADELLQNLKDGTSESNKDRVARGFPELEVLGWVEKPI